ncbi:glycosyltransferase [Vibrio lamellibrachiae]|uniref:glycosyltransferase n=1 Tax=Vibrio lamellibrachiae TaxID=2910253 RepID=UPI003D0EF2D1
MKKISIAMYSTVKGSGWKSDQICLLKENGKNKFSYLKYGIKRRKEKEAKNEKLSYIPMVLSSLYYRIANIFGAKKYYGYMLGEELFGLIYKNKILVDSSSLVLCKARPISIINKLTNSDKKIVLEYSEMHPEFMARVLLEEYIKFNISVKNRYIFTDVKAVNDSKIAIEKADKIIVLNKESKNSFINEGIDDTKLCVLNLPAKSRLNNNARIKLSTHGETTFISTAFHSFVKGTHRLLLAWREANITDSTLMIVGPLNKDIQQFIKDNGPFKRVKYTGRVDIKSLYSSLVRPVGISLSYAEGFSRSTLEYLEHGFPVIVSKVCTLDTIKNEVQGFIVDTNDNTKIVETLRLMAKDRNLYSELVSNIQSGHCMNLLTDEEYVEGLEQIFDEVINEN